MWGGSCSRCRAPLAQGARLCGWCGGSQTADSGGRAVGAVPRSGIGGPGPPLFGRHWRGSLFAAVCAVVFFVVVFVAVFALGPPLYAGGTGFHSIHITGIFSVSPDNACGLNGADGGPVVANGSSSFVLAWYVPANASDPLPCTVSNASTSTPGFGIADFVPVTVTSVMTLLSFAVTTPGLYTGPLNITFR